MPEQHIDVSAIGLEAEVEQVAHQRNRAEDHVTTDVADHAQNDVEGRSYLPGPDDKIG